MLAAINSWMNDIYWGGITSSWRRRIVGPGSGADLDGRPRADQSGKSLLTGFACRLKRLARQFPRVPRAIVHKCHALAREEFRSALLEVVALHHPGSALSLRRGSGESLEGEFQHDMKMIRHHGEGIHPQRTPDGCSSQVLDKAIAVCVVADNVLTPVAAGHQVIDRSWILNSQSPCHTRYCNRPFADLEENKL